jgi:hypothetical protein
MRKRQFRLGVRDLKVGAFARLHSAKRDAAYLAFSGSS